MLAVTGFIFMISISTHRGCGTLRQPTTHHDGIHFYGGANGQTTGVNQNIQIYNGLFDGDWGFSNTANIFFEDAQNATIYNNLFYSSSGSYPLSNGVINNGNGPSHQPFRQVL